REGLLLDSMDPEVRGRDPLIEGCEALPPDRALSRDLGRAIETWLTPAFGRLGPVFGQREPVLLAAACRLADLGSRLHPDHRADIAFEQALRAPIAGLTHPERAFLASVAFARHTSAPTTPEASAIARVLPLEHRRRARALGAAVRLACDLSGRNPRLLEKSKLAIEGDRLVLTAAGGWGDMLLGEQTAKRAQTLATALRLKLDIG
ncbi:MAG: Ppx/GppA family phosphatase, partial [Phenylobacterium sp.]